MMRRVKLYYRDESPQWMAEVSLYEGDEHGVQGWGDTPDEAFSDLSEELNDLNP